MSHTGTDGSKSWDRIDRYGDKGGKVAENISFGKTGGDTQVIQLYIDDGVPNRGHRVNMLDSNLKLTGMAYCSHKGYGKMMVVVYATRFDINDHGR